MRIASLQFEMYESGLNPDWMRIQSGFASMRIEVHELDVKRPLFEEVRAFFTYRIAGGFPGHLFSRISLTSASGENIFCEVLGATPSSCSVPTCQLCARSVSSGR